MPETSTQTTKSRVKSKKEVTYFEGLGRRKSAIARVRVYLTKKGVATLGEKSYKAGTVLLNGNDLDTQYPNRADRTRILKPLAVTDSLERYVVTVKTVGGGRYGQIGAISQGLARALAAEPTGEMRVKLRNEGLLTRDPRARERRSVGTGGKARRIKQSPKR
jgi:small subunit ribosomal protein S9